ncbi:MAG: hypothetical protein RI890_428 [Actinomycetota bacterium]|jgi:hypothetical protein
MRWHDVWVKRFVASTLITTIFLFANSAPSASAKTSPLPKAENATSPTSPTSLPTAPGVYDLENEPSECIGFLPKPGCGKAPEDAGERGGALQYAVFAIMIAGLCVVGFGITRTVRKQKRI